MSVSVRQRGHKLITILHELREHFSYLFTVRIMSYRAYTCTSRVNRFAKGIRAFTHNRLHCCRRRSSVVGAHEVLGENDTLCWAFTFS